MIPPVFKTGGRPFRATVCSTHTRFRQIYFGGNRRSSNCARVLTSLDDSPLRTSSGEVVRYLAECDDPVRFGLGYEEEHKTAVGWPIRRALLLLARLRRIYQLGHAPTTRSLRACHGKYADACVLSLSVRDDVDGRTEGHPYGWRSAPDFTVKTLDTRTPVQLASLSGDKPAVLIFGSFT